MSSPSGQKQPKVQALEQLCCGLEQVLMQAMSHSLYTWLAGHWPTAVGIGSGERIPPHHPTWAGAWPSPSYNQKQPALHPA